MRNHYQQLQAEERAVIMLMQIQKRSIRDIARTLRRAPSSISRELLRNTCPDTPIYDPVSAGHRAYAAAKASRPEHKLAPASVLFGVVCHFLRERWSPQQIAGTLRRMYPDDPSRRTSR